MIQEILPEISLLGVWFNTGESHIVRRYASAAKIIPTRCLESYYYERDHWTATLRGKNVLVMHPFESTMRRQYEKRLDIWRGQDSVLPEFNMLLVRVPHQPSLVQSSHADWFAALEDLKHQMSSKDFDIALIGAGAYSLPLAVHAKRLGRKGIHLGGATQIYFGIKGRRWDRHPVISNFYNEYWTRPLPEDTPSGNRVIENGCYW